MVNINSIKFNYNCLTITANLKTSSNQVIVMVSYEADMGSAGNIMPLYIYKNLFPRATIEQLATTRDIKIKLKMYNNNNKTIRHM